MAGLGLSRVTQVWGSSLADLQPVPPDKLDVLLRVCTGDGVEGSTAKHAGDVLARALPLARFLEKADGKHADQVVPALLRVLREMPAVWTTPQNGPLQTQADFTQLLLDLRSTIRNPATPPSAAAALSSAVEALLQGLFVAAAAQPVEQLAGWMKCGANLLLRALTRSPQFVADPLLPLLPRDAAGTLAWLNRTAMATRAAATSGGGGHSGGGRAAAAAAAAAAAVANGPLQPQAGAGGGQLLLRDDKFYLLLAKLILTATGLSPEAAAGAAAAPPAVALANGHGAGAGCDPGLLCELLEWSSSKVKLSMEQLLKPSGASDGGAPSREAATASAALAATCIHTLQGGPPLSAELEGRLRQQVEELLETALAVGEAAAASAGASGDDHDPDGDKVLALGARILDATTPFVAAAARRGGQEQQLELAGRLQALMLAAARLAGRHGVPPPAPPGGGSGGGLGQILEDASAHPHHHHLAAYGNSAHGRGGRGVAAKLRTGVSRLAARRGGRRGGGGHHWHRLSSPSVRRLLAAQRAAPASAWGGPDDSGGLADDLQTQLLVAEVEPSLPADDLAHPWSWDATQPLTTLSDGVSQLPLSCGFGGFMLARAAAEMLGEALAAAWRAGSAAPVRRVMLLPQGANGGTPERVVTTLCLGRLYVKVQADAALGRLLLPLLADLLTRSVAPGPGARALSGSGAGGGGAGGGGAGADGADGGDADGGWDGGYGAGQPLAAEVAGAVVCALEGMASACVAAGRDTWLYDQALQLLLLLYREPSPMSLQLLAGPGAHPETAGLLADALHLLAVGLADAPQRARQGLRLKLLLLFSDVAPRVGGASGVVTADLGDLLVAVAVAAEGLRPRTLRLLSGGSSSLMSMHDIQARAPRRRRRRRRRRAGAGRAARRELTARAPVPRRAPQSAQREDASTTRLFRSLWLYSAMHKLVAPVPRGEAGSAAGVAEWQAAAGRLAAVTPLLVVGTDSFHEADMVERLKVELGEQLDAAGSRGSPSSLAAALVSLLGGKAALASGGAPPPPPPAEAVLLAFIVAVALAELSRAALAPLPDLDDAAVASCPISVTLSYLKGVLPDGAAAAWVAAIVRRAAPLYTGRLLALAARQEQEEEDAGMADMVSPGVAPAPALAYAEQLACALIANLGGGLGAGAATAGTSAPAVAALADELLVALLAAFPALLHSQPCYCALLAQLEQEEGDAAMGAVKATEQGRVWERTKAWVEAAAEVAPMTTEALLHSFLTCADSLPGSTPQLTLDGEPTTPGGGGGRGGGPSGGGGGGGGAGTPGARQARGAATAAFRRAADLLQACGAARRRLQPGQVGDTGYEGALGLTRKLHYTGYVQGLMQGRASADAAAARGRAGGGGGGGGKGGGGPSLHDLRDAHDPGGDARAASDDGSEASAATLAAVAEEIATQLEGILRQPNPRAAQLAVAQLSATALLAVQPDDFSYSPLGMRLLGALARAPLRHLTPDTMRLSQFSWCWVSVESPEVLVPLISSLGSAWIWTLDQRLGLFSGPAGHAAAHAPPPAGAGGPRRASSAGGHGADGGAAGGGHLVPADDDDAGTEVVHDEATLQAIAAHFLWLGHLLETWAVVSRLRDGRAAAARAVIGRLLAASLQDPAALCHHPAAVGAYFRLLTLGLALLWFRSPPRYFARCTRQDAAEQLSALEAFIAELAAVAGLGGGRGAWPTFPAGAGVPGAASGTTSCGDDARGPALPHPVWGVAAPSVSGYVQLLQFLAGEELARLRVWVDPRAYADATKPSAAVPWRQYVGLAWQVDPCLALSMLDHFPAQADVRAALEGLVLRHAADPAVQGLPKAALLLATAKAPPGRGEGLLRGLAAWAPGSAAQGLQLLSGPAGATPAVRSYAIKCLFNERPEKLVFFLPQLVQLLRGDADGAIRRFFTTAAAHSELFAHQLIWALDSEAKPPEEAFNPEVKRSGWQPPKDTGLWDIAAAVRAEVEAQMTPEQREYWAAERGYFEQVTALSGYLYKFSKDERRAKLQEALEGFAPPRPDLYLPTNPEARVARHVPSSGACMQSAAKVPILVAFDVELPTPGGGAGDRTGSSPPGSESRMACIFKVGDDIRQDVLAIQVIRLLSHAFDAAGLGLYLRPYGCLPTGYECGIIEVVPNTKSRAALGELSDRGLHDIFASEFGAPGSAAFEAARHNFVVSEAAYAVASYLLQAKDRHNGNIMLDDAGHIVHIDFGFILEISPGGNMGFESAAFKLSHEMTQVLDPGGRRASPQLALFEELVVRAYLAARTVAEPIIATVSLMADSGLPCFGRGAPVANLRQRFHLEMSDAQAAAFMRSQIADAYDNSLAARPRAPAAAPSAMMMLSHAAARVAAPSLAARGRRGAAPPAPLRPRRAAPGRLEVVAFREDERKLRRGAKQVQDSFSRGARGARQRAEEAPPDEPGARNAYTAYTANALALALAAGATASSPMVVRARAPRAHAARAAPPRCPCERVLATRPPARPRQAARVLFTPAFAADAGGLLPPLLALLSLSYSAAAVINYVQAVRRAAGGSARAGLLPPLQAPQAAPTTARRAVPSPLTRPRARLRAWAQAGGANGDLGITLHRRLNAGLSSFCIAQLALLGLCLSPLSRSILAGRSGFEVLNTSGLAALGLGVAVQLYVSAINFAREAPEGYSPEGAVEGELSDARFKLLNIAILSAGLGHVLVLSPRLGDAATAGPLLPVVLGTWAAGAALGGVNLLQRRRDR
ncbi:PI4KA1 [Scenedesmus sp. PABB004]|nr:PI4KA1 [Scenedesmus sp. PABB004]